MPWLKSLCYSEETINTLASNEDTYNLYVSDQSVFIGSVASSEDTNLHMHIDSPVSTVSIHKEGK